MPSDHPASAEADSAIGTILESVGSLEEDRRRDLERRLDEQRQDLARIFAGGSGAYVVVRTERFAYNPIAYDPNNNRGMRDAPRFRVFVLPAISEQAGRTEWGKHPQHSPLAVFDMQDDGWQKEGDDRPIFLPPPVPSDFIPPMVTSGSGGAVPTGPWPSDFTPSTTSQTSAADLGGSTICVTGTQVSSSGLQHNGDYYTDYVVDFVATIGEEKLLPWTQSVRVNGSRSWYGYSFSRCFDVRDLGSFRDELARHGINLPRLPAEIGNA
jgi:hypothetical protein